MGPGTNRALVSLLAAVTLQAAPPANAVEGVRYVGARTCSGCHKAIYDAYSRTAMGRSMSVIDTALLKTIGPLPAKVENRTPDRVWEVFARNDKLIQSETGTGFRAAHEIAWAVGSGVNGISFIVKRGSHLFQAPLSFYSRTNRWDLSPGFEQADPGFSRPIHGACIACHAARPRPVPQRIGLYEEPPFEELAIGCENCHGPGQLHVAKQGRQRVRAPDDTIVNPRRLPPRLAEDICANCHQAGDTRVLQPGKQHGDFRPGTPLAGVLAIFKLPEATRDEDLLEHHSAMQMSRCFQASAGKLTCLSCHNPHETATASAYRKTCLGCHSDRSCALSLAERSQRGDDCAACHMPKRPVTGISHSALTNHRIIRMPGQPLPPAESNTDLAGLLWWNRTPDAVLPLQVRLAAYGELMERAPSLREHYLSLLDEAREKVPESPVVLAALGRKALIEADPQSVPLLEKALANGSTVESTFFDLAEALSRQSETAKSIGVLRRGIALHPWSKQLRKSLILRQISEKNYSAARRSMQEYLELFPEDSFMRGLTAQVQTSSPQ